jgi:hypothetical protein
MADKSPRNIQVSIVVAIIGLLGSFIVAYFTASSTRSFALSQNVTGLQQKAYSDFLEGQSLLWKAQNQQDQDQANRRITAAKLSILLIGPKNVICSMVNYWQLANRYEVCKDASLRQKDAAIYQAMRREFFNSLKLRHPEIEAAVVVPYLWSCVLPDSKLEQLCPGP